MAMAKALLVFMFCIYAHASAEDLTTLISGHEDAFTDSDDIIDIIPAGKSNTCELCAGKPQYDRCGYRGLNDKSFCSYNYAGEWVCLQNGYCTKYTVKCDTDNDCAHDQSCSYAACSDKKLCYDLCAKGLPTSQPTPSPTPIPSSAPTIAPTAPVCFSCVGSAMYAHCGTRGLHDYSFCANNEDGDSVCIQNMYCGDVTRACNSTEQCNLGDVCAISGCAPNEYFCHRRCESALSVGPPSPAPTAEVEQRSKNQESGDTPSDTITAFAAVIMTMLALIIVALGVFLWNHVNKKHRNETPIAYVTESAPNNDRRDKIVLEI